MHILNIAGYKFIHLVDLAERRSSLLDQANSLHLKGTILLSSEGINITLAGELAAIAAFTHYLKNDEPFADLTFRESYSTYQPFKRMRVKVKKEIITLRQPQIKPEIDNAPVILPEEFKQWLDEKRDITVLDTRNDYEVRFGTFEQAQQLHLNDFSEFPHAISAVSAEKPIVMFCTGGIRCEKAALVMQQAGYKNVYQLHGGILNYFAKVGGAHYQGDCFVFDQRVALDPSLRASEVSQCQRCEGPLDSVSISNTACSACIAY